MESIPLVLVHGWKSHPGIWRRLIEQVRIPSEQIWLFDYSGLFESTISQIAHQLKSFLHEKRRVADIMDRLTLSVTLWVAMSPGIMSKCLTEETGGKGSPVDRDRSAKPGLIYG
jgi:hypothetical protein